MASDHKTLAASNTRNSPAAGSHQPDMRDEIWFLLIGITLLAVVFYWLLALWDRRRVRRKLLRALMSCDGGNFIKFSDRNAGDNQTDFLQGAVRPSGHPK